MKSKSITHGRGGSSGFHRSLGVIVFVSLMFVIPGGTVLAERYFFSDNSTNYGTLHESGSGVTVVAPGPVYNSGYAPYGTFTPPTYVSPTDAASINRKAERKRRETARVVERKLDEEKRKQESDEARANAYQAPPTVVEPIRIEGADPSLSKRADRILSQNQEGARTSTPTPKLPKGVRGMTTVGVDDATYYYKNGEFFVPDSEGNASRVEAPLGATVFEIPKEAKRIRSGDKTYFMYNQTCFRRTMEMGQVVYEVVEPPAN